MSPRISAAETPSTFMVAYFYWLPAMSLPDKCWKRWGSISTKFLFRKVCFLLSTSVLSVTYCGGELFAEIVESVQHPVPMLGDGFLPIGSPEDTLATVYGRNVLLRERI
jgi:hypothetical protein